MQISVRLARLARLLDKRDIPFRPFLPLADVTVVVLSIALLNCTDQIPGRISLQMTLVSLFPSNMNMQAAGELPASCSITWGGGRMGKLHDNVGCSESQTGGRRFPPIAEAQQASAYAHPPPSRFQCFDLLIFTISNLAILCKISTLM